MKLYDMALHTFLQVRHGPGVLRVPGGWLYQYWDYAKDCPMSGDVFVPYNEEFKETDDETTRRTGQDGAHTRKHADNH